MHDFEPGTFVAPHRTRVSDVSCLPLSGEVLDYDITGLENPDRQRVRTVLTNRLK